MPSPPRQGMFIDAPKGAEGRTRVRHDRRKGLCKSQHTYTRTVADTFSSHVVTPHTTNIHSVRTGHTHKCQHNKIYDNSATCKRLSGIRARAPGAMRVSGESRQRSRRSPLHRREPARPQHPRASVHRDLSCVCVLGMCRWWPRSEQRGRPPHAARCNTFAAREDSSTSGNEQEHGHSTTRSGPSV